MRVIGFVAIVVIILLGVYNGGDLGPFLDAGAMLVVLAGLVGGVLMSGGPETWAGISCAFSGEAAPERLQTGKQVYHSARRAVQAAAIFLVAAGVIAVLTNADDVGAIGPGLALVLLGLFWGIFVAYFVLLPLEAGIERRLLSGGHACETVGEDGLDLLTVGVVFVVVLSATILLMANLAKVIPS